MDPFSASAAITALVGSAPRWVPPHERACETSKDHQIRALAGRLKELEAEDRELRKQMEVAYGLVHARGLHAERAAAMESSAVGRWPGEA